MKTQKKYKFATFSYSKQQWLAEIHARQSDKQTPKNLKQLLLHSGDKIVEGEDYTLETLQDFVHQMSKDLRNMMRQKFNAQQLDWFLKNYFLPKGGDLNANKGDLINATTDAGEIEMVKVILDNGYKVGPNDHCFVITLESCYMPKFVSICEMFMERGANLTPHAYEAFASAFPENSTVPLEFLWKHHIDLNKLLVEHKNNNSQYYADDEKFVKNFLSQKEKENLKQNLEFKKANLTKVL